MFKLENLRRVAPAIALVATLGLTACSELGAAERLATAEIVASPDCDKPTATTYEDVQPGDVFHFGHVDIDENTLFADASALVGSAGQFNLYRSHYRKNNQSITEEKIAQGVRIILGTERYVFQSTPGANEGTLQVTIGASCA